MKPPLHLDHTVAPWWRYRWTLLGVALALVGVGFNAGVWICAYMIQ